MHDDGERAVAASRGDLAAELFSQELTRTEVYVGRPTRLVAGVLGTAFLANSAIQLLGLLERLMSLDPVGLRDGTSTMLVILVELLLGAMLLRTARRGRDVLQEREERRTRERRELASD